MTNLQENLMFYFAQQLDSPFLENPNKLELI